MWLYLMLVVVVIIGACFLGSAVFLGWFEVKNRPREEQFWCARHGNFRKSHALPMANTLVCPRCYMNALKEGDKVALWKK